MFDKLLIQFFKSFEEILYAVAYGSYGRGEESYIHSESGEISLYNDIDIILVVEDKDKFTEKTESIKQALRIKLNTYWVDILVWDVKDLSKKRRTMFSYDLINGHKLFKGDSDSFNRLLSTFSSDEITPYDTFCTFKTRMWALLSLYGDSKPPGFSSIDIFKSYQCAKVIITIADFVCLSAGKYTSLISDKINNLNETSFVYSETNINELLEKAKEVKKNPSSIVLTEFLESSDNLRLIHKLYFESFECYMKSVSRLPGLSIFMFKLRSLFISVVRSSFFLNYDVYSQSRLPVSIYKLSQELVDFEITNLDKNMIGQINKLLSRSY